MLNSNSFAGMFFENESPTYLLSKGDKAGAETSAKALWGDGYESELYASASKDSGMLLPIYNEDVHVRFSERQN